jgi:NAD(P)H-nitrite reductase large subunit
VLAVAIGVRPRVELAKAAALAVDRGIVVDPCMQTNAPGVYAAGDCAQVGKAPLDVLWPTALAQGRVAGANMGGTRVVYLKGTPCNVTMLTRLKVTIIGTVGRKQGPEKDPDLVAIARGDSESWRLSPRAWVLADHDAVNRVRLFIGERTIVGALVMGDQTWSRPLQRLIAAAVDITPIRPGLARGGAEGLTHLARFYQEWESTR